MENKNSVYVRTEVRHRPEKATLLVPEPGLWTKRLPWMLGGAGALLLAGAATLGIMAVRLVAQEQTVRAIWLDIAKDRGLSEKLVPAVRGDLTLELAALALALVGGVLVFSGLARAALLRHLSSSFTIGEDPASSWVCSSRRLPEPRFALASIEDSLACRFQVCLGMNGLVHLDDGQVFTLAQFAQTRGHAESPVVQSFLLDAFREVRIEQDEQVWVFSRSAPASLKLPLGARAGLFTACLAISLVVGLASAAYLNRLTEDPIFSDRVESQEIVVQRYVKAPDLVAEKKKQLQEAQLKDQEKLKPIFEPVPASPKTAKEGPSDPRRTESGPSGPASRVPTQQGIGVANVLASSVSAMTASLTASNSVFGQETENLSDLLADFDGGELDPDGNFGPRGGPGGQPSSGSLAIGGNPNTGWGGIFSSDRSGPPRLADLPGRNRREPILRDGRPEISGKLDPNEVRAVIRAHRNEVHHCYQKGLLENDRSAGVVRVVFHLNPGGRAMECRVEENLSVSSVGQCICGRIQTWRFPQPEGGLAKISYAWTLQPGG